MEFNLGHLGGSYSPAVLAVSVMTKVRFKDSGLRGFGVEGARGLWSAMPLSKPQHVLARLDLPS